MYVLCIYIHTYIHIYPYIYIYVCIGLTLQLVGAPPAAPCALARDELTRSILILWSNIVLNQTPHRVTHGQEEAASQHSHRGQQTLRREY